MGANVEIREVILKATTGEPMVCVGCMQKRILHWVENLKQWLCSSCKDAIPEDTKSEEYRLLRQRLYGRKYSLRDVNKWLRENGLKA